MSRIALEHSENFAHAEEENERANAGNYSDNHEDYGGEDDREREREEGEEDDDDDDHEVEAKDKKAPPPVYVLDKEMEAHLLSVCQAVGGYEILDDDDDQQQDSAATTGTSQTTGKVREKYILGDEGLGKQYGVTFVVSHALFQLDWTCLLVRSVVFLTLPNTIPT